jgi:hypothetical protein
LSVRLALALAFRTASPRSRSNPVDVRALIQKMHRANPIWGAPRIHGELQKLGIEIAETTVAKYLGRRPASPSPTWRTFLRTQPKRPHFTQIGLRTPHTVAICRCTSRRNPCD